MYVCIREVAITKREKGNRNIYMKKYKLDFYTVLIALAGKDLHLPIKATNC